MERFGKFSRVLQPGLQFLVPLVDNITYVHSLKEEAHSITQQSAITHDNVTIAIDGILYLRVVDPVKASCAAPLIALRYCSIIVALLQYLEAPPPPSTHIALLW